MINRIFARVLATAVLAAGCAAQEVGPQLPDDAPKDPPKPVEELLDKGLFDHYQMVQNTWLRRGYERFWINEEVESGALSMRGETIYAFENRDGGSDYWEFHQDLQCGVRGFQKYFLRAKFPTGPGNIQVARNQGVTCDLQRTMPGEPPGAKQQVELPLDGVLLDKNAAHQWTFLTLRLVQGAIAAPAARMMLDPDSGRAAEIRLSAPKRAVIEAPQWTLFCNRVLVTLGTVGTLVYYDDDGRVLRVESPQFGIRMIRRGAGGIASVLPEGAAPAAPAVATSDFSVQDGRSLLSGTLTTPVGAGPFPCALILSDAGAQNRDGNPEPLPLQLGHQKDLALGLAAMGIATIRWDDPGTGLSFSATEIPTITDWISNARAVLRWAKEQKTLDPKKIGLIGHGEGSLIALQLAANGEVPFIVLVSGHGATLDRIIEEQMGSMMLRAGASKQEAEGHLEDMRTLHQLFMNDEVKEWKAPAVPEKFLLMGGQRGWFRDMMRFNPVELAAAAQAPVLAIHGREDRQIPVAQFEAVRKALTDARKPAEFEVFEGLDHLMMPAINGEPGDASASERRVAPQVIEAIGRWLLKR